MTLALSLDAGCWECGSDDVTEEGLCRLCVPSTQLVPADRTRDVYGRGTVFAMLRRMTEDGAIDEVDGEIAALASEARRLMEKIDQESFERGISEVDLADKIRQSLDSVVKAKEKRQKLLLDRGYVLTFDAVRSFLFDVDRVLRQTIDDEDLLREVGYRLSTVTTRLARSLGRG